MLICHVINSLNRGGAETHLFDLITEQIKNNDVVKIVAIGPDSKNIISLFVILSNFIYPYSICHILLVSRFFNLNTPEKHTHSICIL